MRCRDLFLNILRFQSQLNVSTCFKCTVMKRLNLCLAHNYCCSNHFRFRWSSSSCVLRLLRCSRIHCKIIRASIEILLLLEPIKNYFIMCCGQQRWAFVYNGIAHNQRSEDTNETERVRKVNKNVNLEKLQASSGSISCLRTRALTR